MTVYMNTEQNGNKDKPFVTVIMPVRNEEHFIERSLDTLLRQTYPKNRFEVIIADGMSEDRTRDLINGSAAKASMRVLVLDNPKQIAPTALNIALSKARGDFVVRIDGHCEIDPDYISNCVELLQSGKADGVGGPIETIGSDARSRAIALAMSSKFGVGGSAFRTIDDREMYTDTVAFPGYSKEIINKAGPFNEELVRNQDDEYNYRIRKLGGRILLSPKLRSRYYSRSTYRSLWRQYFQYGYWKVRVLQLHPRQMRIRQFVPLAFVCSFIVLLALSFVSGTARTVFTAFVGIYLAVGLIASIGLAGWNVKAVILIILSYFVLHFSYGLGFLTGLITFIDSWSRKENTILPISDSPIGTEH